MARVQRYVSRTAAGGDGLDPSTPWTLDDAIANAAAGYDMNLLNDGTTWALSGAKIFTAAGTMANPVRWRGYTTTIGDWWQGFNADGTLNTTNFPRISFGRAQFNNYNIVEGIYFDFTTSDNASACAFTGQVEGRFLRIDATHGNGAQSAARATSTGARLMLCDIYQTHATSTAAGAELGGYAHIHGCRIISTAGYGVRIPSTFGSASLTRNLIVGCGSHGILLESTGASDAIFAGNNTIEGCGGNGVDIGATFVGRLQISNSIIRGNAGYGIDLNGAAACISSALNRFYDNASGDWNDTGSDSYALQVGAITGAGDDFVNAASGDWRLLRSSLAVDLTKRGMSLGACGPQVGGILGYGHS